MLSQSGAIDRAYVETCEDDGQAASDSGIYSQVTSRDCDLP